jgi:hypothetical protein
MIVDELRAILWERVCVFVECYYPSRSAEWFRLPVIVDSSCPVDDRTVEHNKKSKFVRADVAYYLRYQYQYSLD